MTDDKIKAFERPEGQTRDVYGFKRLQAVRLYGSGIPTQDIMQLVQCSDRRIRDWVHQYQQQDLDGLKSQWQGNNALKLSREQRADLKQRVHEYRPDQVIAPECPAQSL